MQNITSIIREIKTYIIMIYTQQEVVGEIKLKIKKQFQKDL